MTFGFSFVILREGMPWVPFKVGGRYEASADVAEVLTEDLQAWCEEVEPEESFRLPRELLAPRWYSTVIVLKGAVRVAGVRPELVLAMQVCERWMYMHGADLMLTSVMDGSHMRGSLHYVGQAMDFRRPDLWSDAKCRKIAERLSGHLGSEYDVVLEDDHFHVEFQPK